MAATKKSEIAKRPEGLGALVQDGSWDFGTIFNASIEKLSTEQKTLAFLLVDLMDEVTEDRREALRTVLIDLVKADGRIEGEKKHFVLDVDGNEVKAQRSTATKPDQVMLKALLDSKGLKHQECFDEVVNMVYNPSKYESLVERGVLKKDEVAPLFKEQFSLKVSPNKQVEKDLDLIRERLGKLKPAKAKQLK